MATLGELCRQHTSLTRDEINHLKQLVSEWGLLADLCFADLLLYVPSTGSEWLIVAQVRPAASPFLGQWRERTSGNIRARSPRLQPYRSSQRCGVSEQITLVHVEG